MLKIGLTGGICSGKSTVAQLFAQLGVPVIDADVIAREVLTSHPEVLPQIFDHFGSAVKDVHGQLNRAYLRSVIFEQPHQRKWLEALLHPLILKEMARQIASIKATYCIVVIPLLLEVRESQDCVDRILVVDVSEETQISRTQQRDHLSQVAIDRILQNQVRRDKRLAAADEVIDNDTDLATLKQRVQALHEKYLQLAMAA